MADNIVGNVKDLLGGAEQASAKRNTNGALGKDAFLQLLVSQLKNQDPMSPMQDADFIAQMAQFSSLEQMQNMNKLMEQSMGLQSLTQASSMIGKNVALNQDGEVVKGKVSEIRQVSGNLSVVVDGKEYPADSIFVVSDKSIDQLPDSGSSGSGSTDSGSTGSGTGTTTTASDQTGTGA